MMSSMYSGISGLNACTQRMAVIGDNIANVNTTGYKSSELSFENLINQSVGGFTGQEVGSGVLTGDLRYDWQQGTIQRTSSSYDMAIAGNGFFMVSDGNKTYYTRDGEFKFDSSGNLQTSDGMAVQGVNLLINTPVPSSPVPTEAVVIDMTTYQDILVDDNGVYSAYNKTSGLREDLFQIAICDTTDSSVMAKSNGNLYIKTTEGDMDPIDVPGTTTGFAVETSSLEMSNVDIAKEFVNMITAQRAFSANSKVITTSDEILQELVNIKR